MKVFKNMGPEPDIVGFNRLSDHFQPLENPLERLSYASLALLAHWFTPIYNARLQLLVVSSDPNKVSARLPACRQSSFGGILTAD